MKKRIIFPLILPLLFLVSCNEQEWLNEQPLGLFTDENSFSQPANFEAAVIGLYALVRDDIYQSDWRYTAMFNTGTDIGLRNGDGAFNVQFNDYTNNLNPQMQEVEMLWNACYDIIAAANVVIGRIDGPQVEFASDADRNRLKAEALFFRGFAHRFLVHIYGAVPLVLEEIKGPKRDFTRTPKEEVVTQIIADLEYAAEHLPEIDQVSADGRLCKAAANHLLAEMYITAGEPGKAIAAASKVIDNPAFALMNTRFGTRQDEPGDVYWDLFRFDNQNRQGGLNTEAIWVCQFEMDVAGGGNSHRNERYIGPQYYLMQGPDGVPLFIGPTTQNGGRGISWTGVTNYADSIVWEKSGWNDIRTSDHNILRDMVADNPESAYYGQKIAENGLINPIYFGLETWNPTFVKNTPINNHPEQYFLDRETGLLSGSAGRINPDNYIMRLAETYLLRAEAWVADGNPAKAAEDINVIRTRAHATQVDPADVDLDYILDERARELMWEVPRRLTLQRTGKLVERVRNYNRLAGGTIKDHHQLWPIPFSAIENNPDALLEQNPGY